MTTVRRAEAEDAAALASVAASTFALACPPTTTQVAVEHFIANNLTEPHFERYLGDPNRELLIVEVDGVPAGYTMIAHGDPADPDVAASISVTPTSELSKCYVLEGFHGAGVARTLIEASVETGRAHGSAAMWLGVNQHNERANRFYEKNGFSIVGTKRFRVGDNWEDDFVRERVL